MNTWYNAARVREITNSSTATAEGYPYRLRLVTWSIKYTAIVTVAFAGPPPVRIHTMSNSCSDPIMDRKAQVRIVGPSSGIVILRCTCHQVAPSRSEERRVGEEC